MHTYDIFEGTEQIQQLVIARALSGMRVTRLGPVVADLWIGKQGPSDQADVQVPTRVARVGAAPPHVEDLGVASTLG